MKDGQYKSLNLFVETCRTCNLYNHLKQSELFLNLQFHTWDSVAELKVKTKSHDLEKYQQKLYLLIISILNLNIIYGPKWQSKYIFMYLSFFFKWPEAELFGQAGDIYISQYWTKHSFMQSSSINPNKI